MASSYHDILIGQVYTVYRHIAPPGDRYILIWPLYRAPPRDQGHIAPPRDQGHSRQEHASSMDQCHAEVAAITAVIDEAGQVAADGGVYVSPECQTTAKGLTHHL